MRTDYCCGDLYHLHGRAGNRKTVWDKLSGKADILGGVILIGIGLEIFITSFI